MMATSPVAVVCVGMAGQFPLYRSANEVADQLRVWQDYLHAKNKQPSPCKQDETLRPQS